MGELKKPMTTCFSSLVQFENIFYLGAEILYLIILERVLLKVQSSRESLVVLLQLEGRILMVFLLSLANGVALIFTAVILNFNKEEFNYGLKLCVSTFKPVSKE